MTDNLTQASKRELGAAVGSGARELERQLTEWHNAHFGKVVDYRVTDGLNTARRLVMLMERLETEGDGDDVG